MSTDLRATYRVQFHAGFAFAEAAAIMDYLADLGISHLYCSPYLQAAPGQHARLRRGQPSPSQPGAWRRRGARAFDHGAERTEPGPGARHRSESHGDRRPKPIRGGGTCSRTAHPAVMRHTSTSNGIRPRSRLRNTIVLPVLGDHYGRVLERGEIACRARRRALHHPIPRSSCSRLAAHPRRHRCQRRRAMPFR